MLQVGTRLYLHLFFCGVELVEYATWLGMDLTNHKNLLWIAKEALIAPLPSDWKPCLTEEDEIYYFNFTSGRSIWDHPCDEYYRQVYKEEVEKLNKLQQGNQKISNSSPSPRDEGKLAQSSSKASQSSSVGDSSCRSSLERGSIRDLTVGHKPSFPVDSPSCSDSNHLSRSLPPPYLVGHPAMLNFKGGSFDSMICLYAARLASNGGSMPLADFLKLQGSLQVQKNKSTTSCLSTTSFDEKSNMHEDKRRWLQGDGRRDFEKRITQIKDRIEKKLVDEERVVLQQERVEMLERVCKQVQQEESHVLDSLRREILERMERNIREETQALLAKRRKEIVDEVEAEIQAEKLVRVDERRSLDRDKGAIASRLCAQAKEAEVSSLEGEGTNTGEVQVKLKEVGDTSCAQHRGQDEAESLTQKTENEHFAKKPNVDGEPKGTQNLDTPITISSRLLNEGEGTMKDSAQTLGADERKFEKSFHVQDSRTSLVLKLEVFLKVGTSNDLS
ncbi:hypothetical protein GOP47_0024456 [Adiantum capillus-veneris]|uniref:WW domain-containing protein n=1 Tax=Adiantum capillus-veneris TaxID=13818 RepID=A0A9D4U1S4_ADICA|nr:hypothetical protein GOP47_0024456 [Adiantum capillus-veneris]